MNLELTAEVATRLVRLVRDGQRVEMAADGLGIPGRTLQTWLRRGRQERVGSYRNLVLALRRAAEDCRVEHLEQVRLSALRGDWDAFRELRRCATVHRRS
jgi:hypothetical protein